MLCQKKARALTKPVRLFGGPTTFLLFDPFEDAARWQNTARKGRETGGLHREDMVF
jgi:hypothetical protein